MKIDKMNAGDILAIMEIEKDIIVNSRSFLRWKRDLNSVNNVHYFVGRKSNICLGYYEVLFIDDVADIYFLAVDKEHRCHGYGQRLLEHLINMSKLNLCEKIFLEVRKGNIPAQNLYKKNGFVVIDERKNYYRNNMESALVMCTDLK